VNAPDADRNFFEKNTSDLQGQMRAKYKATPCEGEGKTARAGTMENNGKNNAGKQHERRPRQPALIAKSASVPILPRW
jgi:hypothetical protein